MEKKKLLILTSYITGHGHKSITNAIEDDLNKLSEQVEYKSIEAFELAGPIGTRIGKLYGPITRNAVDVWRMVWKVSIKRPNFVNKFIERMIRQKLKNLLENYKPDAILSVHPAFNASVIDTLERYNFKIPFITLYADLISISPIWIDKRATLTISPTQEGKVAAIKAGVPEDTIEVINLPIRKKIADTARLVSIEDIEKARTKEKLNVLIMSGGEGSGNLSDIIYNTINSIDCNISVVAGRNEKLKDTLEGLFYPKYENKIKIYGFVDNMEELMISHDIAIVRGSPNVLMECISCCIPVIITGVLPGQEEGNIDFVLKNSLGMLCTEVEKLPDTLHVMLKHDRKRLIDTKMNQYNFRDLEAAKKIAETILKVF